MRNLKYSVSVFVLLCFFSIICQAQKVIVLSSKKYINTFNLNIVTNELQPITFKKDKSEKKKDKLEEIELKNNELIIRYDLTSLKETQFYRVSLKAFFDEVDISPNANQLLGDFGEIHSVGDSRRKIIWEDIIQSIPSAKGELKVELIVELWGDFFLNFGVDCNQPPEFKFKQQSPYYAAAAIGISSIIGGEIYLKRAKDNFKIHESTNSVREYDDAYVDYESDLQKANRLFYFGAAIIVVDVISYFGRRKRHFKRLKIFEENCNQHTLNIQPELSLPTHTLTGSVGLNLKYNF